MYDGIADVFFLAFHPIFLFISDDSHHFYIFNSSICLMNVMTKCSYRTLLILHISSEKARCIDRAGGINVSSLCIQTSSNEQHHAVI